MALKILVLAKQVPDTTNVGEDAMKADGTVNRAALPVIFNPDDLNALEQALLLKDRLADVDITLLTMGPPRAVEIIRDALYRGIDRGYLITDRRFAGADTLATSYVISKAIEKLGGFDLILCGRQAIDGDTAQVGPQTAEKLNLPQVTYCEEIQAVEESAKKITVKRRLERGIEIVRTTYPAVITVHGSAKKCRPANTKLLMKYKHAKTTSELQAADEDYIADIKKRSYLEIEEIGLDDLNCDMENIGLAGSPTKVKKIENVVFKAKEAKVLTAGNADIKELMTELVTNHTLG